MTTGEFDLHATDSPEGCARKPWAQRALARWSEFPVDRLPRPLVLVSPRVFSERGFASGAAKRAFLHGHLEIRTRVPDEVLGQLLAGATPDPEPGPLEPLVITAATSASTRFATDRGERELPAWRLESPAALGPIWVLDPEVQPAEWRPPSPTPGSDQPGGPPFNQMFAELAPDELTVTLHFIGGNPAFVRYPRAEVTESRQAVALIEIKEDFGPDGPRTAEGYERVVTGRLQAPLGARVLVDLHGNAREVR
ncbi:MAG TPA: hypothetical protein VFP55_01590 [Solirubrobacteraceae bacterium]|nr:hypothetical protein [Solirubrobacteraceae bacterium]